MPRIHPEIPLFDPEDALQATRLVRLSFANPCLPVRVDGERDVLGPEAVDEGATWTWRSDLDPRANIVAITARLEELVGRVLARLAAGAVMSDADRVLYQDLCFYYLFDRYDAKLQSFVTRPVKGSHRVTLYRQFARDYERVFRFKGSTCRPYPPEHLFACIFQIRRAYYYVFTFLRGASLPAALLRAAAWESIFTRDLRRYGRSLYKRMDDVPTLVLGQTGTGKELVARAIGFSRYVAFDPKTLRFVAHHEADFHAVNLSALSPSIIESELFGHRRGAFTGAAEDHAGWLEICKPGGTVFLDEIGELDLAIQVKLLRVLQTRKFQRLGETEERTFSGKIVAATHRDLAAMMRAGTFRSDLYYRLCADQILTPTLRTQLDDAPAERRSLVRYLAEQIAGEDEADQLAAEVEAWIDAELPADCPWLGNVRELEQCVRGVMVRGMYQPAVMPAAAKTEEAELAREILEGKLAAEEMLRRYTTLVYARTRSYRDTARLLGVHRNTVTSRIDRALLERLTGVRVDAALGE